MPVDNTALGATIRPAAPAETVRMDGLIWGYRFDEDGRGKPLDGPAATVALERAEAWIWLHFDLIDGRARHALANLTSLPAEAREMLLESDPRQRITTCGQTIAGVVTDFERADELDPRRMASWRFCMTPHAFISARRSPLHSMAEMDAAIRSGRCFNDVMHLFDSIIHGFADALASVAHGMADKLDDVEDGFLASRGTGNGDTLGAVRRMAVRLRRQAFPLQAMLHRLLENRPAWFTKDAVDDCEDVAHRVDSLCADLSALQERAHALQDELAARQVAVTNRQLMLLSVASAVMLPPTLVSGIFGMNVDGLPLKDNAPLGFVIIMGVMLVSVVALVVVLRRMQISETPRTRRLF